MARTSGLDSDDKFHRACICIVVIGEVEETGGRSDGTRAVRRCTLGVGVGVRVEDGRGDTSNRSGGLGIKVGGDGIAEEFLNIVLRNKPSVSVS